MIAAGSRFGHLPLHLHRAPSVQDRALGAGASGISPLCPAPYMAGRRASGVLMRPHHAEPQRPERARRARAPRRLAQQARLRQLTPHPILLADAHHGARNPVTTPSLLLTRQPS
jgi:hypothetical protein